MAESDNKKKPAVTAEWIYDSPVHSDVEAKLRKFLIDLANDDKILGIQISAYKDGEVIIDTAAGVLGVDDPRPVQLDSLFNVFSATKGITAGMMHWLVDNGKLKLDDDVAKFWPEFGSNGKDGIKVHHVLNHTSGLHMAFPEAFEEPLIMVDWDDCLKRVALSVPETEPGKEQWYHALTYGWLCGGIIEHASGKKFQEILEEAFIRPLNVAGELFIGIPPGVESRLAVLTTDEDDLKLVLATRNDASKGPPVGHIDMYQFFSTLPEECNRLDIRRAIIPGGNGHCSARALARYYAVLADGGIIPPPHSSLSKPPLGSHPYIPNNDNGSSKGSKIFSNPKIHDQFLGVGDYDNLAVKDWRVGLGFYTHKSGKNGSYIGFGHAGMGGSTGLCLMKERFSIAVTLNKLSLGSTTGKIIHFVCSELNLPMPAQYMEYGEKGANHT